MILKKNTSTERAENMPAPGTRVGLRLGIPVAAAAVFGLIAALLRCFLLFNCYNPQSGSYDAAEPGIVPYFMWLTVLLGLLLSVWTALRLSPVLANSSPFSTGISAVLPSLLMACVWIAVMFEQSSLRSSGTVNRNPAIVTAVFSVLAALVTLTDAVLPVSGIRYGRALAALVPAAALVLLCFEVYFDETLVINCPNKPIFTLAACICALFLVLRCRFFGTIPHPTLFAVSGLGVITLGLFSGVPGLVWFLVRRDALLIHVIFDILMIAFSLYTAVLLLTMRCGGNPPEAEKENETGSNA